MTEPKSSSGGIKEEFNANVSAEQIELSDSDFDMMSMDSPDQQSDDNKKVDVEEFTCDKPHWRINRDEFIKLLGVIGNFPSNTSIYFSLTLEKADNQNYVKVFATNKDYYLKSKIELSNMANCFESEQTYFFKYDTIRTLVRSYSDFVLLFEDGNVYYYNTYVKYKLDVFKFDQTALECESPKRELYKMFTIPRSVFESIKKLVSLSLRVTDSKVLFNGKTASGFFMLYAFSFDLSFEVDEPFFLRKNDISVLSSVFENQLQYQTVNDRVWFNYQSTEISFLKHSGNNKMETKLISEDIVGNMSVDIQLLQKAMSVISSLGGHVVTFEEVTGSAGQNIVLRQDQNASFAVGSGKLSQPFYTSLDVVKRVIFSLPIGSPTVEMLASSTGLRLELLGGTEGQKYRFDVSRISQAALKRNEKENTRQGDRDRKNEEKRQFNQSRVMGRPEDKGKSAAEVFGVSEPSL